MQNCPPPNVFGSILNINVKLSKIIALNNNVFSNFQMLKKYRTCLKKMHFTKIGVYKFNKNHVK